jgi:hypothetical protein
MKQYCQVNDTVLCFDCGVLYEAKVLRVEQMGALCKYFVHYKAWARKFDKWVDEPLIALKTDLAKQEKIITGVDYTKEKGIASAKESSKRGKKQTTDVALPVAERDECETAKTEIAAGNLDSAHDVSSGLRKRGHVDARDGSNEAPSAQPKLSSKRKIDTAEMETLKKNNNERKRLALMDIVDEDDEPITFTLTIPFPLKRHVAEEWSFIAATTSSPEPTPRKLLRLPKPTELNVESILKSFLAFKIPKLEKDKVQVWF